MHAPLGLGKRNAVGFLANNLCPSQGERWRTDSGYMYVVKYKIVEQSIVPIIQRLSL